jgi:dihydroorotase
MLEFDKAPFGITGLETAVGLALTELKLPPGKLIEMFSLNPQRIMRITPWGIFEGSAAHLTVLDPARQWTFDVSKSQSRSRNSPFHGWNMKGKTVATIVHGKVVYEDRV